METSNNNDLQNLKNASVVESDRERGMVNEQVLHDVKRLMNALPDAQREVVFMRYYQNSESSIHRRIVRKTSVLRAVDIGRIHIANLCSVYFQIPFFELELRPNKVYTGPRRNGKKHDAH